MKNFILKNLSFVFFLGACQSNADSGIKWSASGALIGAQGKKLQLEISGIYETLQFEGDTYFAGFKIDSEGDNLPEVARVNSDLSQSKYWSFGFIPNDLFVYRNGLHLVTTNGEVYKLDQEAWVPAGLTFPAEAKAVYSDQKDDLLVCYPASLAKEEDQQSGCKSIKQNWTLDFIWRKVTPKVCTGKLYLVEEGKSRLTFKQVDLASGKLLSSQPIKKLPEDICNL